MSIAYDERYQSPGPPRVIFHFKAIRWRARVHWFVRGVTCRKLPKHIRRTLLAVHSMACLCGLQQRRILDQQIKPKPVDFIGIAGKRIVSGGYMRVQTQ